MLQLNEPVDNKPTVYVLWDGIKSYYVGSTCNYRRRLKQHRGQRHTANRITEWRSRGVTPKEYWRINLDTNPTQSELVKFENLVRERLQQLFPLCDVG